MDVMTDGPTLVLAGSFDARSTWRVRGALHDLLAVHDHVVVDLTDVTSVDVTALKVLAASSRQAVHDNQHLTLRGCSGNVRRLLAVTHLRRLVEVEDAVPA